MQTSRLPESILSAEQSTVSLAVPSNGQALQVQLVLQVLQRRAIAARAHPQAQGEQALEDPHLPVLRQELYTGDVPAETHAEARRANRQTATNRAHIG